MEFYYSQDGSSLGPVTKDELKGKINRETLVWFEGLENWKKASEIPELVSLFQSIPPPLPLEVNLQSEKVVDVRLLKESKPIITPQGEVRIANEIRSNVILIVVSLVIAFLVFIFYGIFNSSELTKLDYGFKAYEDGRDNARKINNPFGFYTIGDTNVSKYEVSNRGKLDSLFSESRRLDCYTESQIGYSSFSYPSISDTRDTIAVRLKIVSNEAKKIGIWSFFIAVGVLIIGRYFLKGVKWVGDRAT